MGSGGNIWDHRVIWVVGKYMGTQGYLGSGKNIWDHRIIWVLGTYMGPQGYLGRHSIYDQFFTFPNPAFNSNMFTHSFNFRVEIDLKWHN